MSRAAVPRRVDDVIVEFVTESTENLDRVEQDLIALEQDPTELERIGGIFRAIHTVKGTCGFFGLHTLEKVAHAGENLLSKLRDGEIAYGREVASVLLELVDAVRGMVASVAATGKDGDKTFGALIERLDRLAASTPDHEHPAGEAAASTPATRAANAPSTAREEVGANGSLAPESAPAIEPAVAASPSPEKKDVPARHTPARAPVTPDSPNPPATADAARPASPVGTKPTATIRVDVKVLDDLMNLVGELVLARNQLLELISDHVRSPLVTTSQRLNQITSELQSRVMKTRMQPIGNVWNKVPRVARELAMQCGKEATVDLEGSETELDKTVLEAISEPLAHLIRNCVDHGLESPDVRRAAGKPPQGRLSLAARHEGGHVLIDIGDDGAGVDVERVKNKAREKGIITAERAARMTDQEAFSLLFAPGFSTAERVTNISGRGVGMDVVRTNIERIGGSVEIRSVRGQSTTFRIRLPLTLAIVPAIIVASSGLRFAIPQLGLQELLRSDSTRIEHVHGAPVYRLRGRLLPLVWLSEVLRLAGPARTASERNSGRIVVLQAESGMFGLVVDEVSNSEEVVVKPLTELLSGLNVYAGATILGDGNIALILDASNLAKRARRTGGSAQQAPHRTETVGAARSRSTHGMVLCLSSDEGRIAVPLRQVERLEKIRCASIESTGGLAVTQYRGDIIPVFGLEQGYESVPALESLSDSGTLHALIHGKQERRCAVVVRKILDIVELDADADSPSAIIDGRVTALVDLDRLVERHGHFFETLHGLQSRESAA